MSMSTTSGRPRTAKGTRGTTGITASTTSTTTQTHTSPYFKAWVTYKPNGNSYWESFYYWQSPSH